MPPRSTADAASADRSASDPLRVFGNAATISSKEAPTAEASADAEPPPGVGRELANAASRSRTDPSTRVMILCCPSLSELDTASLRAWRSLSYPRHDHSSLLDDSADGFHADSYQI